MKCLICGSELKSLSNHIRLKHNISSEEYYRKFLLINSQDGCCLNCGKSTQFRGIKNGYSSFCDRKCANTYNADKVKKTCMLRYGVDNPSKVAIFQKKKQNTNQEKYGCCWPMQNSEVRNKVVRTNFERYGVYQSSILPQFVKKAETTCLKKYGHIHFSKSLVVKDKRIHTCLKKYGVNNPFKVEKYQEKFKRTCIKRFGVSNPMQVQSIKNKYRSTCLDRFGYENFSQTLIGREISRRTIVARMEKEYQGDIGFPTIGKLEPKFFKWLQLLTIYEITRPEYNMHGYFPDGYIEELNLVIEFDEPYHNYPSTKKHDELKDQTYIANNLKIFRVSQIEWQSNSDKIKFEFQMLIIKIEKDIR